MALDLRSETAKEQTNKVAHCKVCGIQWQVKSFDKTDAKGCGFCGASKKAITITSEAP